MNNEYEFNIGDLVITSDGETGRIIDICRCDACVAHGFYEPMVDFDGHDYLDYITYFDYDDNFSYYYCIGKYTFGNLDIDDVEKRIARLEEALRKEKDKMAILQFIKRHGGWIKTDGERKDK